MGGAHIRDAVDPKIPFTDIRIPKFIYHHGIVINSKLIIHFKKDVPLTSPVIKGSRWDEFCTDQEEKQVEKAQYEENECLSDSETIKRALCLYAYYERDYKSFAKYEVEIWMQEFYKGFLGNLDDVLPTHFREYSLLDFNCEHFAFWCKTGESHSEQSDEFKDVFEAINEYL